MAVVLVCSGSAPAPIRQRRTAELEHREARASVAAPMVRYLQAMAEDGRGAKPCRLGPGCCDQQVSGPTLSF